MTSLSSTSEEAMTSVSAKAVHKLNKNIQTLHNNGNTTAGDQMTVYTWLQLITNFGGMASTFDGFLQYCNDLNVDIKIAIFSKIKA